MQNCKSIFPGALVRVRASARMRPGAAHGNYPRHPGGVLRTAIVPAILAVASPTQVLHTDNGPRQSGAAIISPTQVLRTATIPASMAGAISPTQ
jgi:hypothetical protein